MADLRPRADCRARPRDRPQDRVISQNRLTWPCRNHHLLYDSRLSKPAASLARTSLRMAASLRPSYAVSGGPVGTTPRTTKIARDHPPVGSQRPTAYRSPPNIPIHRQRRSDDEKPYTASHINELRLISSPHLSHDRSPATAFTHNVTVTIPVSSSGTSRQHRFDPCRPGSGTRAGVRASSSKLGPPRVLRRRGPRTCRT